MLLLGDWRIGLSLRLSLLSHRLTCSQLSVSSFRDLTTTGLLMFLTPSVCLSTCLSDGLCLPVRRSVSLPVCLSVYLYVCLPVCLSVYLSICLPVLSVCLPVLFIYLSCLSTCLSVCLPVCGTHLRWEFLLLLTWPRPEQPGVGHFSTFSYMARTWQAGRGERDRKSYVRLLCLRR